MTADVRRVKKWADEASVRVTSITVEPFAVDGHPNAKVLRVSGPGPNGERRRNALVLFDADAEELERAAREAFNLRPGDIFEDDGD